MERYSELTIEQLLRVAAAPKSPSQWPDSFKVWVGDSGGFKNVVLIDGDFPGEVGKDYTPVALVSLSQSELLGSQAWQLRGALTNKNYQGEGWGGGLYPVAVSLVGGANYLHPDWSSEISEAAIGLWHKHLSKSQFFTPDDQFEINVRPQDGDRGPHRVDVGGSKTVQVNLKGENPERAEGSIAGNIPADWEGSFLFKVYRVSGIDVPGEKVIKYPQDTQEMVDFSQESFRAPKPKKPIHASLLRICNIARAFR